MDYLDPNQQVGACYDNPLGASRFVSLDLVYKIEPVGNDFYLELNPLSLIRPLTVDYSMVNFEHEPKSITFNELPKFNQTFEKERVYLQGFTMRFTPSYSNRSDHYGSYGVVITNKEFQLKDYDAFYESSITQYSKLIDVQSNQSLDSIIPVTPQEVYSNEDFINPQKKRLIFQQKFTKNITIEDAQFNFQDSIHDDFTKLLNQSTLLYIVEFNAPVQDSYWDLFKSRSCIISGVGPIYQIYMDQSNNTSVDFHIIRKLLEQPIVQQLGSGLVKTIDIKVYSVKEQSTPRLILLGKTDGVQYTVDVKANYLVTSSSAYDFLGSPSIYPTQQDYIIRNSQIQFLYETGYPYVFIREDRIIQNFLKLYESITIEDVRGLTGDEGILKAGLFSNLGRWLKKNQKNLASIFLSLIKEDPVELAMSLNNVVQSSMEKKKNREIENVLRAGCSGFKYDQELYPSDEIQIYPIPPIGVVMDQIQRSKVKEKQNKKKFQQERIKLQQFFKNNGYSLINSFSDTESSDESIKEQDSNIQDVKNTKLKTGCIMSQMNNDQYREVQYRSPEIPMVHLDVSQTQLKFIQNRSPKHVIQDEPNKVGLDGLQLYGTDLTGKTQHWNQTKMYRKNFKRIMKKGYITIPVMDMYYDQIDFQKMSHTKLDLLLESLPSFKTLILSFGFGEDRPQLTISRDKKGELWIVDLIRMFRTKNLILNSKTHYGLVFHMPNLLVQNDHFNKYRKLLGGMYVKKSDSTYNKKNQNKGKNVQNVSFKKDGIQQQVSHDSPITGQGINALELFQDEITNQNKGRRLITESALLDEDSVDENQTVLENVRSLVRQNQTQARKKTQTPKNNAFQNYLVYQNVKGVKLEFDDNPKAFNAASFRREGIYIVPLIQETKQKAIPSYFIWREGSRINENPQLQQVNTFRGSEQNIISGDGISLLLPSILKVSDKSRRVILDAILISRGTPGDIYGEEKLADIQISLDIMIDQNIEVKEISDDSWHASLIAFMNNIPNGTFVTGGLTQQIIQVDKREISSLAPQKMEIQYQRMKLSLFQEIKNQNPNKCAFFMVSNYLFITKFFQKEGQLAKFAVDQFISRLAPYQVLIFTNWNCIHDQLGGLMMSNNKYSSQLAQYVQDYVGLEGFYPLLKNVSTLLKDKVTITSTKLSTLLSQYPQEFGLPKEVNFQLGWNSELTGTFQGLKILRAPPTLSEPSFYQEISDFIEQSCIVNTSEFMSNNKNEVNKFISEYKKSTDQATETNAKFANTYFLPQFTKANLLANFVFFSKNKPEAFFNEDQSPKMQLGKLHGLNNYRTIAEAIYSRVMEAQYSMYNKGSLSQLFIITKWLIQRLELAWKLQGKGQSKRILKVKNKNKNQDTFNVQKRVTITEPEVNDLQSIQQYTDEEYDDDNINEEYQDDQNEVIYQSEGEEQEQDQIRFKKVQNQSEQEILFD